MFMYTETAATAQSDNSSCPQLEILRSRDGRDGRDGTPGTTGPQGAKGERGDPGGQQGPRGPIEAVEHQEQEDQLDHQDPGVGESSTCVSGGGRGPALVSLELNWSMLGELQGHFIASQEVLVTTSACLMYHSTPSDTPQAHKATVKSMEQNMNYP